jgi:hypothetical protein
MVRFYIVHVLAGLHVAAYPHFQGKADYYYNSVFGQGREIATATKFKGAALR